MFWGFLMLSSDMLDLATANWFSGSLLPSALVGPWNGMVELGYASALVGCVAALARRVLFTPEKLKGKSQLEGNFILLLILTITSTSFILNQGRAIQVVGATRIPGFRNWIVSNRNHCFILDAHGRNLQFSDFNSAVKTHAPRDGPPQCILL